MFTPIILPHRAQMTTDAAMPLIRSLGRMINIFWSQLVPMDAMSCFVKLISISALRILSIRHWLHVIWKNAVSYPAQVINLFSFRNWTYQQFIAKTMSTFDFVLPSDASVTTGVLMPYPDPTSSLKVDPNFRLQAIRQIAKIPIIHKRPHDIGDDVMGAIFLERQG